MEPGTVTYLLRIALPADAVVHVRLEDVSRADAPAVTLAEQTIPTDGQQVPIPFTLDYAPERIEPRHRYAVRAEIRGGDGALLWTTDTMHPVLTSGAASDPVEVRVVQAKPGDTPREMSATSVFECPDPAGESFRFIVQAGPDELALRLPERFGGRYLRLG